MDSAAKKPISPPPPKRGRLQTANSPSDLQASTNPPAAKPPTLPDHHLRIYSWNIDGIAPFIQSSINSFFAAKFPANPPLESEQRHVPCSLRNFLGRHGWPQVVHLQEVKIRESSDTTKRAVRRAVNSCRSGPDDGPEYVVRFCLPRSESTASGSGRIFFGVASIIRRDFFESEVCNIREVGWDSEGRVLVIETHSKLSLWNIYAVNGTDFPYKDPQTGKMNGSRHERKLAFHASLIEECKRLQEDGWHLVLAGDLNVASRPIDGYPRLRTRPQQHIRNRDDFNAKFFDDEDGMRLIDTFRHLHPTKKEYSWLARQRDWKTSCDRIDYFLTSRSLEGALVAAEILMTPLDRGTSDHVPIYLQIDPNIKGRPINNLDRSKELRSIAPHQITIIGSHR